MIQTARGGGHQGARLQLGDVGRQWALDHVKSLLTPTPAGDWFSAAVVSKGEYGVPPGLVFGYPCRSDGKGNFTHRRGRGSSMRLVKQKFQATLQELQEEKAAVQELVG